MFRKIFTMLFIMTSLLTFATYVAEAQDGPLAIVTEGLVSYWPLDEFKTGPKGQIIVEDIVGDNDGVVNRKQKVEKGKFGNAFEFNGNGDQILFPTAGFNTKNQAMTVTVWVFLKEKGRGGPSWHGIVHLGEGQAGKCFWVHTYTGRRRGVRQIRMTQCVDNGPYDVKGPELPLKEWHHVAAVYDGAKKNLLYLDGVEVATTEIPAEPDVQIDFHPEGARIGGGPQQPQLFAVEPGGKLSLTWAKIKASR
jgi:hypothetical protein